MRYLQCKNACSRLLNDSVMADVQSIHGGLEDPVCMAASAPCSRVKLRTVMWYVLSYLTIMKPGTHRALFVQKSSVWC